MVKYDLGGLQDSGRTRIVSSVDVSQFPEVSIVNVLNLIIDQSRDSPWGIKKGGSIASIPLVYKGILYFGANDYNFYAVNAKTGKEMWRFSTGGPASTLGSASIWRERIIFSSYDRNMYCISMDGKRVFWKFSAGDKIATTPAVHEDVVFFGSKDCNFYAVSAETGKEMWKLPVNQDICCPPLIHKGSIYFGSRDGVYKVSLDGRLLWKFPLTGDVNAEMGAWRNVICFGCSDKNIYALSTDGKMLWRFPTEGPVIHRILVQKGKIYTGSLDGNVYCLNIKGNLVWKFSAEDSVMASPRIYDERVYFSSFGSFYCISMDGKPVWKLPIGTFSLFFTVKEGVIYAPGWDCKMRAISIYGNMLWEFNTNLSYQSEVDFEPVVNVNFEIVHTTWIKEEEKVDVKKEKQISDYGEFGMSYTQHGMRDYLGSRIDETGLNVVYKRKKDIYR